LDTLEQSPVRIERGLRLVARLAERRSGNQHQRRREVDARYVDTVDHVDYASRGEQRSGLRTRTVEKVQHDGCVSTGHTVDRGVARVGDLTTRCLNDRLDDLAGVAIEYAKH